VREHNSTRTCANANMFRIENHALNVLSVFFLYTDDNESIARTFLQVSPVRRPSSFAGGRIINARTYRPGAEQFLEPMSYIESVRENARLNGICRILPPPEEWKVRSVCYVIFSQ